MLLFFHISEGSVEIRETVPLHHVAGPWRSQVRPLSVAVQTEDSSLRQSGQRNCHSPLQVTHTHGSTNKCKGKTLIWRMSYLERCGYAYRCRKCVCVCVCVAGQGVRHWHPNSKAGLSYNMPSGGPHPHPLIS